MIKKTIFFTVIAASLFFLGAYYLQNFKNTSGEVIKAEQEQKFEKEQAAFVDLGKESDGAKLYRENLQKDCNMISGYAIASKKTKKEWEEIAKNGKIADTIKNICPNIKFDNIWTPDIYEYLHKNAPTSKS